MKKLFFIVIFCMCQKIFSNQQVDTIEDKICVVFVSDEKYLPKFYQTYEMLRTNGNYHGDVVLIITDIGLDEKILESPLFENEFMKENFKIKYFPKIQVTSQLINNCLFKHKCLGFVQKYHVFDRFFSSWDYVFYMDCGMHIYSDITKIINLREKNTILAHSNCYYSPWNGIYIEFKKENTELYKELETKYDMTKDYFQTGMMLFDTNVISKNTKENIKALMHQYPIGTGDQSYIALYFTQVNPRWKQITLRDNTTWFYDFSNRHPGPYIMCKYPGVCYKYLPDLDPNLNLEVKH